MKFSILLELIILQYLVIYFIPYILFILLITLSNILSFTKFASKTIHLNFNYESIDNPPFILLNLENTLYIPKLKAHFDLNQIYNINLKFLDLLPNSNDYHYVQNEPIMIKLSIIPNQFLHNLKPVHNINTEKDWNNIRIWPITENKNSFSLDSKQNHSLLEYDDSSVFVVTKKSFIHSLIPNRRRKYNIDLFDENIDSFSDFLAFNSFIKWSFKEIETNPIQAYTNNYNLIIEFNKINLLIIDSTLNLSFHNQNNTTWEFYIFTLSALFWFQIVYVYGEILILKLNTTLISLIKFLISIPSFKAIEIFQQTILILNFKEADSKEIYNEMANGIDYNSDTNGLSNESDNEILLSITHKGNNVTDQNRTPQRNSRVGNNLKLKIYSTVASLSTSSTKSKDNNDNFRTDNNSITTFHGANHVGTFNYDDSAIEENNFELLAENGLDLVSNTSEVTLTDGPNLTLPYTSQIAQDNTTKGAHTVLNQVIFDFDFSSNVSNDSSLDSNESISDPLKSFNINSSFAGQFSNSTSALNSLNAPNDQSNINAAEKNDVNTIPRADTITNCSQYKESSNSFTSLQSRNSLPSNDNNKHSPTDFSPDSKPIKQECCKPRIRGARSKQALQPAKDTLTSRFAEAEYPDYSESSHKPVQSNKSNPKQDIDLQNTIHAMLNPQLNLSVLKNITTNQNFIIQNKHKCSSTSNSNNDKNNDDLINDDVLVSNDFSLLLI
ncbi:uncharacterized protein ASCRUDRAFT_67876 [Ascoidea rubescens DSM 1968]|uniref:Uncharacterized protein n=1 Tax=Ascoidea rubescens DSM 1968 TaxID=1344418 RepID=A0A1D2VQD0_9ASCO|nr:hypothetical protein ASCRUDRAFT_67876 [Ascoidea rubescens DSM 1968]ODV63813.1 hypothetical protein ASCRUDRAFT_67876 [Ascoidea rubescens DSM 1968]